MKLHEALVPMEMMSLELGSNWDLQGLCGEPGLIQMKVLNKPIARRRACAKRPRVMVLVHESYAIQHQYGCVSLCMCDSARARSCVCVCVCACSSWLMVYTDGQPRLHRLTSFNRIRFNKKYQRCRTNQSGTDS